MEFLPSDKKFGRFLSLIFLLLFLYNAYHDSMSFFVLFAFLFILSSLITVYQPSYLNFLNKLWYKFGILIGKIISPIVMGFIFYLLISPVAILMRLFGRDELILKKNSSITYWRKRHSSKINPNSFKNQF